MAVVQISPFVFDNRQRACVVKGVLHAQTWKQKINNLNRMETVSLDLEYQRNNSKCVLVDTCMWKYIGKSGVYID